MNSSRISTEYNVVSTYKDYKREISTYNSEEGITSFPGCDKFNNPNIKISASLFPNLCVTAIRFLYHLKERYDTYRDDGCKYLYYWLYVYVLNRNTSTQNTLIFYKNLNKIFNDDNDGLNTLDNYINKMDEITSDNLVKLIDIYEKFYTFENEFKTAGVRKKCTSECIHLFTKYLDECVKGYDYEFCKELKNFREQYNIFVQKVLNCEGEQYLLPPVENFDTMSTILMPFILIIVASLILPILYKFTPFGQWIHRKIRKKKDIVDNINEEENNFLHAYDMDNNHSKNQNYNIMHNSS
ncbi:PIR Superfamily Protein [Plasmodium ovale curtisi]|uniref:PIR Superfamily Protein n=1 Tax=Plasmodium ovale curtisi TaxID=864141 RepID=A0A1A8X5L9_PLAOA|nr:PIR Superfamily Protein [Plasmodium ovale curtisi]SBS99899.1 PIR Superfamily Protein [Plasmodium ovale curtisi]